MFRLTFPWLLVENHTATACAGGKVTILFASSAACPQKSACVDPETGETTALHWCLCGFEAAERRIIKQEATQQHMVCEGWLGSPHRLVHRSACSRGI